MGRVRLHGIALGALALTTACQGSDALPTGASRAIEPAAGPKADRPAAQPVDWAQAGDCLEQLRVLQAAIERGTLAEGDRPPVALLVPERGPLERWLEPDDEMVVADLPLIMDPARAARASCTLEILPAQDVRAEIREVGREEVLSLLQTGVRTERNPEYDVAAARVRQAEREMRDDGPKLLRVGDPMLDLIGIMVGGVLSGFGQIGDHQDVDAALAELANTPRSTERPVHRPYEFERTVLRGWREASFPVELVDRQRGQAWRAELRQREMRELYLLDGLDPRDQNYEQHRATSITRNGLERWRQEPPPVRLSGVVAALLDGRSGPSVVEHHVETAPSPIARPEQGEVEPVGSGEPWLEKLEPPQSEFDDEVRILGGSARDDADGSQGVDVGLEPLADTRPSHRRPAARDRSDSRYERAAAAPRREVSETNGRPGLQAAAGPEAAGVVGVNLGEQAGSGFYVAPYTVLTSARLLGHASVIDVTTAEGTIVPGLISHVDRARDLALIQVPKQGTALRLHGGPLPEPGTAVAAIGHGRSRSALAIPGILNPGPAAPAGLDLAALVHIESEMPADAAAAGGPVQHGGEVIAVISDSGPGRGFLAIPVSEVLELLKDAGPAAQR
jgi:S1-C subfamily serine protease